MTNRLMQEAGWEEMEPSHRLHALQCIRLLLRGTNSASYCALMAQQGAVARCADEMAALAAEVVWQQRAPRVLAREMLHEYASILKKLALAGSDECRAGLVRAGAHNTLVALLRVNDGVLLSSVLVALIAIAANPMAHAGSSGSESEGGGGSASASANEGETDGQAAKTDRQRAEPGLQSSASMLVQADCVAAALSLVQAQRAGRASPFGPLAAELLLHLCRDERARVEFLKGGGCPTAVAALHGAVSASLATYQPSRAEQAEAVSSLVVTLLRLVDTLAAAPRCAAALVKAGAVRVFAALLSPARRRKALPSSAARRVACSAMARLSVDDEGAMVIGRENGVHLLASMLLEHAHDEPPPSDRALEDSSVAPHIFRALRFIFGTGRNRPAFKRLFPPELFGAFIDVGHYQWPIEPYQRLAHSLAALSAEHLATMSTAVEQLGASGGGGDKVGSDSGAGGTGKKIHRIVRGYEILEVVGAGAFGAVHRAKRIAGGAGGPKYAALKVLPLDSAVHFGATAPEREASSRSMQNEVAILSKLDHPNIVRFYESFEDSNELFIAMELVDGASLNDYLTSLREKGQTLDEEAVWAIFLELMLALQYLHQEQSIVHRDLSPANIIVEAKSRKVKLTDFGLARARRLRDGKFSVMNSVVGTMAYTCPEIVQHMPYSDKADVWSLGCILYQLMALRPPFEGSNPLAMATRIVEMEYDPPPERYSKQLRDLVSTLLTADPDARPRIAGIAPMVATRLMARLSASERECGRLRGALQQESGARRRQSHITAAAEARRRIRAGSLGSALAPTSNSASDVESGDDSASGLHRKMSLAPLVRGPSKLHASSEVAAAPTPPLDLGGGAVPAAAAVLTIQRRKLRPLADPLAQLLATLHKLLFVAQLPPAMGKQQPRRHMVERFVRGLARPDLSAGQLKAELASLASRSGVGVSGWEDSTTYEHLADCVEAEASRAGFYERGVV